jgi:hypothetical protein
LLSLDLSHNDMTDLSAVLTQLQQLTALRSLSLKGNPASLAAGYREAVLQALPQLLYLDGQVRLQEVPAEATNSRSKGISSHSEALTSMTACILLYVCIYVYAWACLQRGLSLKQSSVQYQALLMPWLLLACRAEA